MNSLTIQDVLLVTPDYPTAAKVVSQTCWEFQSYSNECQLHPAARGESCACLGQKGNVSFKMDYSSSLPRKAAE